MKISLFLLIACVHFCLACNVTEDAFNLCNADPICRTSFYIEENDESVEVFDFLLTRLLSGANESLRTLLLDDFCENVNSTAYTRLWTHHMSMYRYCGFVNEYFDGLAHRCYCKPDKQCKYIRPDIQQFHFTSLHLFTIVITVILAFSIFYFNEHLRPIFHLHRHLLQKEATSLAL